MNRPYRSIERFLAMTFRTQLLLVFGALVTVVVVAALLSVARMGDVDAAQRHIGERSAPVHSHNRGNHFALLTDDLDAWEEHLRQQGATYHPPRLRPDGARQIFLVDPDGHYVELCTTPAK